MFNAAHKRVWASVAAVAGEDDISLHNSRGFQMF